MPFAIDITSFCKVETANLITDVVRSFVVLTSITGITPVKASMVLVFESSVISNDLFSIIFSSTF